MTKQIVSGFDFEEYEFRRAPTIDIGHKDDVGGCSGRFKYEDYELEGEDNLVNLYNKWKAHFNVPMSAPDDQERFEIFKANSEFIVEFNKQKKSYTVGLNKFSNLTDEEFSKWCCGRKKREKMVVNDLIDENKNQAPEYN